MSDKFFQYVEGMIASKNTASEIIESITLEKTIKNNIPGKFKREELMQAVYRTKDELISVDKAKEQSQLMWLFITGIIFFVLKPEYQQVFAWVAVAYFVALIGSICCYVGSTIVKLYSVPRKEIIKILSKVILFAVGASLLIIILSPFLHQNYGPTVNDAVAASPAINAPDKKVVMDIQELGIYLLLVFFLLFDLFRRHKFNDRAEKLKRICLIAEEKLKTP